MLINLIRFNYFDLIIMSIFNQYIDYEIFNTTSIVSNLSQKNILRFRLLPKHSAFK